MWMLQIGLFGIDVLGLPFSKIVFLPTGLRPWDFDFLVPPGVAGGNRLQSATGSDGKTHQGAYLSYTYYQPCKRGVKGGAEPPMWERKSNFEKLVLSRLKTRLCKVCRVDSIFLHTFNYRFFAKNL